MKKFRVYFLLLLAFSLSSRALLAQQYIADHTVATEEVLRSIPASYIEKAREELIISYQHTSHGTHVSYGMFGLPDYKAGDDVSYAISISDQEQGKLYFLDYKMEEYAPGAVDLSAGETTFAETTRNYLDAEESAGVNVVMWSWCDISGHDVAGNYLPGMEALISEYGEGGSKIGTGAGMREVPVTFVFMTGHATTGNNLDEGRPGAQAKLINDYCEAHGYFCLDYYSIDSHDMDDNYWDDAGDNGNSEQYGGNFYQDFQDAHSVGDGYYLNRTAPGGDITNGAHMTQYITANRKAYAMWWILARIAGWDGGGSSGISVRKPGELLVYPNPGSGMFYVEASGLDVDRISVTDAAGRTVRTFRSPELDASRISLDLSGLQSGFYMVRIADRDHLEYTSALIIR